jgi:CDGSH-type Zn-finger protein
LSSVKIRIAADGPYLVTGRVPLVQADLVIGPDGEPVRWEEAKRYPERETYALCRCGASKAKPFCDGSHVAAGFDGTESGCRAPYLPQVEWTYGPTVDLTWSRRLCSVARFCHRAGDAWTQAEASGDPAARAIAVEEACCCPSGSLVAWDKQTGKPIEPDLPPSIALVENPQAGTSGPIWVRGGIAIESSDGTTYEIRNRVALCRCGRSGNKPFCDGTHLTAGFKAID